MGVGGLVGAYSVGPVYSRPMFSMSTLSSGAPYLLGSRLLSASLSGSAQEAAASPTKEEEEEEEEEKEEEEEVKEEEAEEKEEEEETKEEEEGKIQMLLS